jgi:hypothetical protein
MRQRAIRRTTLLGALFLLLLSPDDASSQQEDPWHELRAEALGFSVELPGRPEFLSKTFSTILGTVKESAYRTRFDGGLFSVELHELPGLTRLAPARAVLERAGNEVLEDRRGEELSSRSVRAGDHPGRVLTFRSPESGFAIEEAHLVLAGSRLFLLTAGLAEEGGDRSALDRFFGSFRIRK